MQTRPGAGLDWVFGYAPEGLGVGLMYGIGAPSLVDQISTKIYLLGLVPVSVAGFSCRFVSTTVYQIRPGNPGLQGLRRMLGPCSTPDGALAVLGRFNDGIGNEYIWEKRSVSYAVKENPWSFDGALILAEQGGYPLTIQYSSGVVDSNGTIELQAPVQSVTLTSYSQYSQLSVLKGKYFLYTYDGSSSPGVGIYRIDSYSKISSNSTWQYVQIESPVGVRCVDETSIELVGYVNSPNANAFPPSVPDGFIYEALGQLGDGVRIATGSYVGTGTYGAANPNRLTFEFEPKLLVISKGGVDAGYNSGFIMCGVGGLGGGSNRNGVISLLDSNTVTWYNQNRAQEQLNSSGDTYYYLAIG